MKSLAPAGTRLERVVALVAIAAVVAVCTVLFPIGFRGADDYQYLLAAERWLSEGIHVGADHWANRLPYVWSWALAFSVFGVNEVALRILHATLFILMVFVTWTIALERFGGKRAACYGAIFALFTPLLFRMPTFYYPETVEITALLICILLVLRCDTFEGRRRIAVLFVAGMIGSVAMLVRQTAIAVPMGLALMLVLRKDDRPFLTRVSDVAILAGGFLSLLVVETIYYLILTGDPLHRFATDARHAATSSLLMKGGIYKEFDNALFNWELAKRWDRDALIDTHWTLTPIVRLLFSPGLLLLPWFAMLGGVMAWRAGGKAREFALLTLTVILAQYAVNTFVLVTSPNTRYFGAGLLLLCALAGYGVARMLRPSLGLGLIVTSCVIPGILVAFIHPRVSEVAEGVAGAPGLTGELIHAAASTKRILALKLREEPQLADRILFSPPPVGGLAVTTRNNSRIDIPPECPDGRRSSVRVREIRPAAPLANWLAATGLDRLMPGKLRAAARREGDVVTIHRRIC